MQLSLEVNMKKCARCNRSLPAAHFHKQCSTGDGLRSHCKDCSRVESRKWRQANPEKHSSNVRSYARRLKQAALTYYGGNPPKCACCGEQHAEFLVIDHVNGNGNEERRQLNVRSGSEMFRYLKRANYPTGYRVLCDNCNMSRGRYGYCPHQQVQ